MGAASLEDGLPRRPGYGTDGQPVTLFTNYFELKAARPDVTFHRYSVTFFPEDDLEKTKKRRLVEILLKTVPFAGISIATDWSQILVAAENIPLKDDRAEYKIEWFPSDGSPLPVPDPQESERVEEVRKRNTFKALVEAIGTVSIQDLLNDISQPAVRYSLKLETIQTLNIIMAQGPSSDSSIATVGGNRFYPYGSHPQLQRADLGAGLEALRGYFSSVRPSLSRILVNVNVATAAFYKSGPLLALMLEVSGGRPPTSDAQQQKLAAFFRKLKFQTNYMPDIDAQGKVKKLANGQAVTKRKVHTITGISPFGKNSQNVTFDEMTSNGKVTNVTVQDYFHHKYNVKLSNPRAPLVNCSTGTHPRWIPVELCEIMPGQPAKRLLLGPQTSEMIQFAARRPHENAESITSTGLQVTRINPVVDGSNVHLRSFGITVSTEMLTVQGRVLNPPLLHYRTKPLRPSNGSWNLDTRNLGPNPFRMAGKLGSWNTLVISPSNRAPAPGGIAEIKRNLELFRNALTTYGMQPGPVQEPGILSIDMNDIKVRHEVDLAKIKGVISNGLRSLFSQKPNFLLILLADDNAVLYDCIKFVCDCQLGIPTVCNIVSKFSKGQIQYFANVALKFNQKLGGVNHIVDPQALAPLDGKSILFGIDVTHPSPGSEESAPSVAGVVASVDGFFSQFPASMRVQQGRQEMVSELEEMIMERLRLWQKRNRGALPTKVVVYRDGVSEGQYRTVLEQERPAFIKAFEKLYGGHGKHPKLTIAVVGKRHHTRFYPTREDETDGRTGNVKAGTVVDRGITREKGFDFFLAAHQALQGTSKPAHYEVLLDENQFGANQLERVTNSLCHGYAKATRAVSVCPPAYYADLLCERGRCYLHAVLKGGNVVDSSGSKWERDVHPALMETMYYL